MEEIAFTVTFAGSTFQAFYIKSRENAELALSKLMSKDCLFGIDTETMKLPAFSHLDDAALSPHLGCIRLIQVFDGENSFIFDLLTIDCDEIFLPFLESKRFLAHNATFDLMFFKRMGAKHVNCGCTYLLSRLLFHAVYPTDEGLSASLRNMVTSILKTDMLKAEQNSDWSEPNLNYAQIEYAALDPIAVILLGNKLAPGLHRFGLDRIYQVTKRAQAPIVEFQYNGILLDVDSHRSLIPVWRDALYAAKQELHTLTGLDKFTSTTIASYLESTLDPSTLNIWPRTETGKLSTDSHTLADFSFITVVKPFAEYQKKEKLLSTYGEGLIGEVNPCTGRIHARYNLCGARTGRLSSSHPNLQNLPRESDIRRNFKAPEGSTFICADYSQIEIRVGAELSGDPIMLQAYRDGIDLHALTASKVSGKALKEVTKEERQMAKALNFGLMFGLGANKFAKYAKQSYGVEVSQSEAHQAVSEWHDLYSTYSDWQKEQATNADDTKSCSTPCGKKRCLPPDKTYGPAMNQPVQGGAAEVMLHAVSRLYDRWHDSDIKLINTVHDEIILEIPTIEGTPNCTRMEAKERAEFLTETLVSDMTRAYLDVFPNGVTKALVSSGVGDSWAEAK